MHPTNTALRGGLYERATFGPVFTAVGDVLGLASLFKKPPKQTAPTAAPVDTIPGSPLTIIGNGGGGGLKADSAGGGLGTGIPGVLNQIIGGTFGKPIGGMGASTAAATGPAGVGSGGKGIAPPANIAPDLGGGGGDGGFAGLPWLQNIPQDVTGPQPGTPGAIM